MLRRSSFQPKGESGRDLAVSADLELLHLAGEAAHHVGTPQDDERAPGGSVELLALAPYGEGAPFEREWVFGHE
jgi:hypothetical protein